MRVKLCPISKTPVTSMYCHVATGNQVELSFKHMDLDAVDCHTVTSMDVAIEVTSMWVFRGKWNPDKFNLKPIG